jgi:nucleotide-binding universal stress UspA family protein
MLMIDAASGDLTTVARAAKVTARARMRKLAAMPFMQDVRSEVIIRTGAAIEEICRESGRPDIDLIVSATHGYSGFKHAWIGSVAEHVVRYAECPVLTVPSRGAS